MYWHLVRVAHIEAIRMNEGMETLGWFHVFRHMALYFVVFEGNLKIPSKLVHKNVQILYKKSRFIIGEFHFSKFFSSESP